MQPYWKQVTIVGLGLMGGSVGLALMRQEAATRIVGVDLDVAALEQGQAIGAIHWGTTSLADGVADARLVILAAPVGELLAVGRAVSAYLSPGCVVTDLGSTKEQLVNQLETVLLPAIDYLGGHPMAGSERCGIAGAKADLFADAFYVLTPTERTSTRALEQVENMVRILGARAIVMSPRDHDLMAAAVSHLPHLVAAALVNTVGKLAQSRPQILSLAAGGFRDTTRIAASSPEIWRDIFLTNRELLLPLIQGFRQALAELEDTVAAGDRTALEQKLEAARHVRQNLPVGLQGLLPSSYEVVVTVSDQPGVIGTIGQELGQLGINICDIEILRIREGEGGTIRLGFDSQAEADLAIEKLGQRGIVAQGRD